MAPMAAVLGLRQCLAASHPGIPSRVFVQDVMQSPAELLAGCIYVGRGSFHHRLATTKWKSPWVPVNCEADEWLAQYVIHIRTSKLWDDLTELRNMQLACDCAHDQLCEADMLIGLYFDAAAPSTTSSSTQLSGNWARTVTLLQGIQAIPRAVALPVLRQGSIVLAFRKLFPADWFESFKFAMIEDIINSPPFCSYQEWLAARGEAWDGPLVPHQAAGVTRQMARIGEGLQVGATSHRAALPPLLPFNLTPDEHLFPSSPATSSSPLAARGQPGRG